MTKNVAGKGGRPATGSIKWKNGRWSARITLADGSRPWVGLDPRIREGDEEAARAGARMTSAAARARGAVSVRNIETVREYSERWLDVRTARGLTSVGDDRSRLKLHVLPLLGAKPIATVTRDEVEGVVESLDAKIRMDELSWKTARHVWALVTRMFRDAKASKTRVLRVRDDNPTADVEGPDGGVRKGKQFLYPSEALALLSCERVPRHWRRLIAVAIYTFARAGELAVLRWEDVDIERGTLHIHRAANRRGGTKATKTGIARRFVLDPAIIPLLATMRAESGGEGEVLPFMANKSEWSKNLRQYLRWAGVTRADLFASDATRKPMTFHDLRSTGLTWCAVRGDAPLTIQRRAGHSTFQTTELYIRIAESLVEGFGEPFFELPAAVLGISSEHADRPRGVSSAFRLLDETGRRAPLKNNTTKWANRDLNEVPRIRNFERTRRAAMFWAPQAGAEPTGTNSTPTEPTGALPPSCPPNQPCDWTLRWPMHRVS